LETRKMTEEAREQSFAQYLAATKAIDSIRRRKNAEDEESFATTATSSAARATISVLSETLVTPFTFRRGGSMATQQPPTSEDESVEEIIWRVGTTLAVTYRTRLVSRLSELQKAVQEEELDGRGISAKLKPIRRCDVRLFQLRQIKISMLLGKRGPTEYLVFISYLTATSAL
jgi:hypothetical protein